MHVSVMLNDLFCPPAGTETQGEIQRYDWDTAACEFLHDASDGQ